MSEFIPYVEEIETEDYIEDTPKKPFKPHNGRIGRERNKQIVIRMNEEELKTFRERVATTNLTQNAFIIKALLRRKILIVEGAKELRNEVAKVGNNLNQIAKHLNQGGTFDQQTADNLRQLEVALWQCVRTSQTKAPATDR